MTVAPLSSPPAKQRKPTLRHRLEYGAYRLLVGVLRFLPERVALGIGEALGWFVGVVLRVRWGTVMDHIGKAFPEKDPEWHRSLARGSFRHLGRESVATFRLGGMDKSEVKARMEVVGSDAVLDAWKEGNGLIVITGHFGNWEMAGASIAVHGIPVDVIVQRQRNPLFDADLVANRSRLGMRVIERREAPKKVLRALKAGRAVGIVGDQNVRRGGIFVDFFGRPASTARGIALFALRTGCPVFQGVARRLDGYPQRYRITAERVVFSPSGDMEKDVHELTKLHTEYLERAVREAPEQYFWQHRRWKTRPPGESF
jgi:KDO2-lipid IV(A) lauroyltransferase